MKEIVRVDEVDEQAKVSEEEGVEIPLDRINPETLRNMVAEFVAREWSDEECSLDRRIEQVVRQLRGGTAKVVYDFGTETWNIVERR